MIIWGDQDDLWLRALKYLFIEFRWKRRGSGIFNGRAIGEWMEHRVDSKVLEKELFKDEITKKKKKFGKIYWIQKLEKEKKLSPVYYWLNQTCVNNLWLVKRRFWVTAKRGTTFLNLIYLCQVNLRVLVVLCSQILPAGWLGHRWRKRFLCQASLVRRIG